MPNFFNSDNISLKICGITQQSTAQSLIELGVDALGFNFWPQSKRYLNPQEAQAWVPQLKDSVIRIGLFVNQSFEHIQSLHQQGLFDYAQLHGEESPEFVERLITHHIPCIKALRIHNESDITLISAFQDTGISAFLLDAYHPQEQGGSGHSFDWSILSHSTITACTIPIILAGGINQTNITKATQVPGIIALDVASGAESSPGIQDNNKVINLLQVLVS